MGAQDVIALTVAAGAVAYVGRLLWRTMNGRGGCGCSHSKMRAKQADTSLADQTGLTRLPMVTIDQMGKPFPSQSDESSGEPANSRHDRETRSSGRTTPGTGEG